MIWLVSPIMTSSHRGTRDQSWQQAAGLSKH
jgi:hypothetical protein